jgi:hypothetical protein
MKVEILTDHLYLLSTKEMLLVNTNGQSRFHLS